MNTTARVVVVGDVIDDVHALTEGPIRPDTDTLANISLRPGGSAANTSCWIGHLGVPVTFYGRVGEADLARHQWEFSRYGVEAQLQADPDRSTGTIVVIVYGDTRTMLSDRGANITLDASRIAWEPDKAPSILHLTGYSFFHRESIDDLVDLMDRTTAGGGEVLLDCSSSGFLADHGAAWWWGIAEHATIVKGNEDEAEYLTGLPAQQAASAFADHGVMGIVTLGPKGASWCEPGGTPGYLQAAPLGPAGFVDPTGAGDAFSAGVIAAFASGATVEGAIQRGLEVSADAVSQPGARPL